MQVSTSANHMRSNYSASLIMGITLAEIPACVTRGNISPIHDQNVLESILISQVNDVTV